MTPTSFSWRHRILAVVIVFLAAFGVLNIVTSIDADKGLTYIALALAFSVDIRLDRARDRIKELERRQ